MSKFFASVAVQWLLRRIWELGGLTTGSLAFILGLYALMPSRPPAHTASAPAGQLGRADA